MSGSKPVALKSKEKIQVDPNEEKKEEQKELESRGIYFSLQNNKVKNTQNDSSQKQSSSNSSY